MVPAATAVSASGTRQILHKHSAEKGWRRDGEKDDAVYRRYAHQVHALRVRRPLVVVREAAGAGGHDEANLAVEETREQSSQRGEQRDAAEDEEWGGVAGDAAPADEQ